MSEEVEARVEKSNLEEGLQDIRRDIKEVSTNIQKLTAANLTTSPPVITEASLTQKILDGIARQGPGAYCRA